MDWIAIVGLITLGIFLVIAEVLFIPGVFIAGTLGVILSIWGVTISYDAYGSTIGTITMIAAIIGNISAFVITLRGKTWERFSLRESHTSKVNEHGSDFLNVGDKGIALSVLKPIGKALFNDKEVEVRTKGNYVEENSDIEVISIDSNKIIVRKFNN